MLSPREQGWPASVSTLLVLHVEGGAFHDNDHYQIKVVVVEGVEVMTSFSFQIQCIASVMSYGTV